VINKAIELENQDLDIRLNFQHLDNSKKRGTLSFSIIFRTVDNDAEAQTRMCRALSFAILPLAWKPILAPPV
jgi:hypothetical protein